MNKVIKLTIIFGLAVFMVGLFGVSPVHAQVQTVFNTDADDPATVEIANETKGTAFSTSVSADPGDTIKVKIFYHNTGNWPANNTRVLFDSPSSAESKTHTLSGSVIADNSSPAYPAENSVTISISSAESVSYVSGSVRWYEGNSDSSSVLLYGQNGTEIFNSYGLMIGTVYNEGSLSCPTASCNSGRVELKLKVSGTPAPESSFTVTTQPASNISYNDASLNGSFTLEGTSIETWFEYGQTTSFGMTTSKVTQVNTSGNISASISGLKSFTKYYFQAVASDGNEIKRGEIKNFTTPMELVTFPPIEFLSPTVTTGSATSITEDSATLRGYVDPNGSSTTAYFKYGTSQSNLAYSIGTQNVGSGNSSVSVSHTLSGLQSDTTYFYRIVASNSAGTNSGSILSFTTDSSVQNLVPTVTTGSATNIKDNEATLNAVIDPNGSSTTAYFKYGTSQSNLAHSVGTQNVGSGNSSVSVSHTLSGLSEQTDYFFKACATNSVGTTCGAIKSFRTFPHGDPAPNTPTAITSTATIVKSTSAKLNGLVLIKGGADTEAWFEYGTSTSLGESTSIRDIGSSSSVSFSRTVTGLEPGAVYYFRTVAKNKFGTDKGEIRVFKTKSAGSSNTGGTNTGGTEIDTEALSPVSLKVDSVFEEISPGDIVNLTVTYKNVGSETLEDAVLRVILPEGIKFQKTTRGTFSRSENTITIKVGDIEKDDEGDVTIQGKVLSRAAREDQAITTAILVYTDPETSTQEDAIAYGIQKISEEARVPLAAAAIFGDAGFPNSLLEWIILIAVILVIVFVGRALYLRRGERRDDPFEEYEEFGEAPEEGFGAFNEVSQGGKTESEGKVIE